jgi:acetyl esterase/lipase
MSTAPTPTHPDLRKIARWLPRTAIGPRAVAPMRFFGGLQAKLPARDVRVVQVGAASVRVHRPSNPGILPALLWIHGGGYVIGTAAQEDRICRQFADTLGVIVAAVDYRLAPESPFPAPLDDCYDALVWLAGQPEVDASRLAVGGASAGGGLAAAVAIRARDTGDIDLALQVLAYPMLDDRTATRAAIDERGFRLWNNASNRFGWQSYTGHPPGSAEVTGLAAPARCDDLTGLAPAWIGVGTLDLFHDEDVAYADRLQAAGVNCSVQVVPGAFHGFDLVASKAPVSKAFRDSQVAALAAALDVPPT